MEGGVKCEREIRTWHGIVFCFEWFGQVGDLVFDILV